MGRNLQELVLNNVRKDNDQVTVFLMNGFQICGAIKSFDSYTVILESGDKLHLIYKHAISTIIPSKKYSNLKINFIEDDNDNKHETN